MIITLLSLKNIDDFKYYAKYLQFISCERKNKVNSLKFTHRKITSILAELLIRYNICNSLNINNQDIKFIYNEYGKPSLKDYFNFDFSISHTDSAIVFISNNSPIGIDIETIKKSNLKLAKRFFTLHEYEYIKYSATPNEDFFKVWTMKEAYIKMLGTGLHTPLNSFDVLKPTKECYYYNMLYNDCEISICSKSSINSPIETISIDIKALLEFFDKM